MQFLFSLFRHGGSAAMKGEGVQLHAISQDNSVGNNSGIIPADLNLGPALFSWREV